jgi:hypothetical protein
MSSDAGDQRFFNEDIELGMEWSLTGCVCLKRLS